MSGILSLLLAAGNPVISTWSGDILRIVPGGTAIGSITVQAAGTISGANYSGASAWCYGTPPITYYVKFSMSGSAWDSGLVAGTVYSLSTSRTVTWTASGGATKTGTLTVRIYADASGTALLGTGTVSVFCEGTP